MARACCVAVLVAWLAAGAWAADPPGAIIDPAENVRFPASSRVINVKTVYGAKGDGVTDDTAALAAALAAHTGQGSIIYLPNGTYLISAPLVLSNIGPNGSNWGYTNLQGQSQAGTVIRLKSNVFTDVANPKSMMWWGGFGSADWFHCSLRNITFDVGTGNPGAIGVQFYSNNCGVVRDVTIRSPRGQGVIGLDLGHSDMNGPLLVKNLTVDGFATGIRCGYSVNSQTFEAITLAGQTVAGLSNGGQAISIRRLRYDGPRPRW